MRKINPQFATSYQKMGEPPKKKTPSTQDPDEVQRIYEEAMASADLVSPLKTDADSRRIQKAKARATYQNPDATYTLDLHGLTVEEARQYVRTGINRAIHQSRSGLVKITIITGRGRNSGPGGPILAQEIYRYVSQQFQSRIEKMDSPPAQDLVDGLALKGHFDVWLR